ncbi:MAG TPA: hypothetical protein VF103_01685 [Polyangiaceae bacterium]
MKSFNSKFAAVTVLGVLGAAVGVLATQPAKAGPPAQIIPFATSCSFTSFDSSGRAFCTLPPVQTGYHFEILTMTGSYQISSGTRPIHTNIQVSTGGRFVAHYFPATFLGDSTSFTGDFYAMNQSVHLSADSGTSSIVTVVISDATAGFVDISLSGNLVKD